MSSTFHKPKGRRTLAIILLSVTLIYLPLVGLVHPINAQGQSNVHVTDLSYARATIKSTGVVIEWGSAADNGNLGFNVYRVQAGRRTRLNGQIIVGAVFRGSRHVAPQTNYDYAFIDQSGTGDSIYEIESVSVFGETRIHQGVSIVGAKEALSKSAASESVGSQGESTVPSQIAYPADTSQIESTTGQIEDQWAVANKTALKIHIKSDGWYRVTQQQMVAAGFNPTVDIRALQLYRDGREVAIRTNKDVDQFISGDYIEFYGQGVDTTTADTRVYYLIAGISKGKRVTGDLVPDGVSDSTPISPSTQPVVSPITQRWASFCLLASWCNNLGDIKFTPAPGESKTESARNSPRRIESLPSIPPDVHAAPPSAPPSVKPTAASQPEEKAKLSGESAAPVAEPKTEAAAVPSSTRSVIGKTSKGRKKSKRKAKHHRPRRTHRNHAVSPAPLAAPSFDSTVLVKERYKTDTFFPAYYVTLLNGDTENYFGRVIASNPITQTINTPNPEVSAPGPAKLEFALQGVLGQFAVTHVVNVEVNGTPMGSVSFGPLDHPVQKIDIPVSQLVNGANTVKFTKVSSGDVCIVDYLRLTYPHALKADSNSLRFSMRFSQSASIDGFSTSNIRLIDYSDPFAVKLTRPSVASTPLGYAISVSPGTPQKSRRLLYAAQETQFSQPAALSLNQPSSLNAVTNGADLVIIAHKSLLASAAPLVSLRQSQGMAVSLVDVEDVYDEFSYGIHGPFAIKDFLKRAKLFWTKAPRYVIFLGDASLDPRNYEGWGDFDLVPTKLIDATYNETVSDDWLTDFDDDGIADIPTGRLPVRTPAEANLVISKIVNFLPSNAPQTAMLVADDPTNYYFNFELANDEVQSILHNLVPAMNVVRVNKRTDPNAHTNIVNNLNSGLSLVNYSGHGNVNTWTGANIFVTPDALAAANGNKLPLVLVMNCLNGYFQDPRLESIAEGFMKAPAGGAVAAFASSGETIPDGQHEMSNLLYQLLYGSQPIALGDAIKTAKGATFDIDVRRTWIFFGDPSMKIR